MDVSLRLNNDLEPGVYRRIAEIADEGGVSRLWISHDMRWRSAPALIADLAGRTERLRFGIGVHNPYTVHPVELAMIAATLDELSQGRFDLGLGAGAAGFLRLVGLERARPLETMRSTIVGIRQLLTGEPVTVQGWDPHLALARSAPGVGLWLGATGPRMRALGGELADGVLALALPPDAHGAIISDIERGAARRRLAYPAVVPMCVWLSLDDDPGRADQALLAKLALYGPELGPDLLSRVGLDPSDFDPMPDELDDRMRSLAVVGDPTSVIDRCVPLLARAGGQLSFGPPLGPDPIVAVEQLVGSVVPGLRAASG